MLSKSNLTALETFKLDLHKNLMFNLRTSDTLSSKFCYCTTDIIIYINIELNIYRYCFNGLNARQWICVSFPLLQYVNMYEDKQPCSGVQPL